MTNELQKTIKETQMSRDRLKATQELCNELIRQEQEYRQYLTVVFDKFFDKKDVQIKAGFENISEALQNGGSIDSGLNMLGGAFGIKIEFDSVDDFQKHINSEATLQL